MPTEPVPTCLVWDLDGTLLLPGRPDPVPGIDDVLAAWARRGTPMAVATSAPTTAARRAVAVLGWTASFGHVAGTGPGVAGKDEVILEALLGLGRTLPADAAGVAVVGDTPTDVAAARGLGLTAIGVAWGRAGVEDLHQAGASWVARTPLDLRP